MSSLGKELPAQGSREHRSRSPARARSFCELELFAPSSRVKHSRRDPGGRRTWRAGAAPPEPVAYPRFAGKARRTRLVGHRVPLSTADARPSRGFPPRRVDRPGPRAGVQVLFRKETFDQRQRPRSRRSAPGEEGAPQSHPGPARDPASEWITAGCESICPRGHCSCADTGLWRESSGPLIYVAVARTERSRSARRENAGCARTPSLPRSLPCSAPPHGGAWPTLRT